ncbi:MAG: lipoate--protein ligase [Firmicutes bacterium]|nr:lipoate--protein ligase [Bacillota bacterium]
MLYIPNDSLNPYYNLAFEEFVLKELDPEEDYVLLWRNAPAVIIGKFQNTIEEINQEFVKENGIKVVRRMSGGGAVYHDLGNLNYTFIVRRIPDNFLDFKQFTASVLKTLKMLGVAAEFNSRNDLTIEGKKFSGNAQYVTKNRLLHHGTLLFDSKLDNIQKALNVSRDKIESKGIKSVRSRVTNISEHLKQKLTIEDFKQLLLKNIFNGREIKKYELSAEEKNKVSKLARGKYETWDWNYGQSPEYNLKKARWFASGRIEVRLNIKDGIINECKIYGDYFAKRDPTEIENLLKGYKYQEEVISTLLADVDLESYFGDITLEEILQLFLG